MRIAGGIIFLLVGLWSLVGGGCSLTAGTVMKGGSAAAAKLQTELAKAAKTSGTNVKMNKEAMKNLKKAGGMGTGFLVSGIVILLAGILCIIAGIMLFLNKGKMLAFVAGGLGILGEVIFIVMLAFGIGAIIKIVLYAFGAFAATSVGKNA